MKTFTRALALILAVWGPAATAQQAPLIPEATAAEARAAIDAVKALDPPSISRMSSTEALTILRRLRVAQLQVTQTLALALGEKMNEERFKAELTARGLGEMFGEDFQRRVTPIEGKLSPQEKRALERELGGRFPAYGNYLKRALVAGVVTQVAILRANVAEQRQQTNRIPATLDPVRLQGLRSQQGVQSATYGDGVFRIVFDDDIVPGGVVEVGAAPKADGTLDWRCISSENVRQFVPPACRQ